LVLSGYHPWTQVVTVEKGKAVAFDKILLIPIGWNIKRLSAETYSDLTPLGGTDYFLLSRSDRLKDHFFYDWKRSRIRPLLPAGSELSDVHVSSFFSREDSPVMVLSGGPLWEQKYWYARLTSDGAEIKDITKLIPEKPLQIFWDSDDRDNLFTLHHGYINRLDVAAEAFYPRFVEDVRGWGVFHGQLYVVDKDDTVATVSKNKSELKSVLKNSDLSGILSGEKDFYEVRPLANEVMAFLGSRSFVVAGWKFPPLVREEPVGMQYDPSHNRLLLWSRNTIGILDLVAAEESLRSPDSRAKGAEVPEIRWVHVNGRDIKQCFWAVDGSHIVFRDGNKIFLLEPESQGSAHVDDVVSCRDGSSVFYSEPKDTLYFLGEHDGGLYSLELIPKKEPALIVFRTDGIPTEIPEKN
jgi:hypothetical protein